MNVAVVDGEQTSLFPLDSADTLVLHAEQFLARLRRLAPDCSTHERVLMLGQISLCMIALDSIEPGILNRVAEAARRFSLIS